MAKRLIQLLATLLILALGSCLCFATPTVVSPSANSVQDSDSILVSVKLTEKQTVRISVFRQMEEVKAEDAAEYRPYDASNLTEADVALLAAGETEDDKGHPVKLSSGAAVTPLFGELISGPVDYRNDGELGFYTKQISSLEPGLYVIQVDVLGDRVEPEEEAPQKKLLRDVSQDVLENEYEITESVRSFFALKEKAKEEPVAESGIFPARNSALQFLQNLLRSLFR